MRDAMDTHTSTSSIDIVADVGEKRKAPSSSSSSSNKKKKPNTNLHAIMKLVRETNPIVNRFSLFFEEMQDRWTEVGWREGTPLTGSRDDLCYSDEEVALIRYITENKRKRVKRGSGSINWTTFLKMYKDLSSKLIHQSQVPKNAMIARDESNFIMRCKKVVQDVKPYVHGG